MATQDDNPWERIKSRIDETPSPAAPIGITQPIGFRIAAGLGDIFNSLTKYIRDFVFLRLPYQTSGNVYMARKMSEEWELVELFVNYIRMVRSQRSATRSVAN